MESSDEEKSEKKYKIKDVHVDLFLWQLKIKKKKKNFVEEMKTSAIIDTAFTETIPLEEWFQSYIKNLDDT